MSATLSPQSAGLPQGSVSAPRRYRLLVIATHPVQYASPVFRRMAAHPALDFRVAYCSLRGAEAAHDPDFGVTVKWDIPLLDGYAWTHIPNRGSGDESFFGMNNPGLWKLIREGRFDAVVCFTGYVRASFWIAYLAARSAGAAYLFGTDIGTLDPRDGRAGKRLLKKIFWPFLFRLASQVMAMSSGARDLMLSFGISADRITLVPLVVDNDWWIEHSQQADRDAVRATWGARESDRVVLFCAKLQPWKRPADLLRAFAKAKLSNAILVFAGAGPLRTSLEAEAEALGVAWRVRFLGFVNQSQLPAVYTSSDLMVLPSEYEPFAVVVNEAMCCGCPVVASDRVGAARDLVAPVAPQFVFPCGDIDALAAILKDALGDPARLQSVARGVFAHIQTWSPERNIAATIEAIQISAERVGRSMDTENKPSVAMTEKSSAHPQRQR